MPADHINIQHPDYYDVEKDRYRTRLEIDKLHVELKQLRIWHDSMSNNMSALFNRIERGDPAELHYPSGRVFIVTGQEKE